MNTLNSSYDLMHSHILEHTLVATSRMSGFEKPDPLHCYDTLLYCAPSFVTSFFVFKKGPTVNHKRSTMEIIGKPRSDRVPCSAYCQVLCAQDVEEVVGTKARQLVQC